LFKGRKTPPKPQTGTIHGFGFQLFAALYTTPSPILQSQRISRTSNTLPALIEHMSIDHCCDLHPCGPIIPERCEYHTHLQVNELRTNAAMYGNSLLCKYLPFSLPFLLIAVKLFCQDDASSLFQYVGQQNDLRRERGGAACHEKGCTALSTGHMLLRFEYYNAWLEWHNAPDQGASIFCWDKHSKFCEAS